MNLPTRKLAGRLGRLRRRLAATLGRHPCRTDGGVVRTVDRDGGPEDEHLREIPDGAGCTEIWEHLSETREEDDRSDS